MNDKLIHLHLHGLAVHDRVVVSGCMLRRARPNIGKEPKDVGRDPATSHRHLFSLLLMPAASDGMSLA